MRLFAKKNVDERERMEMYRNEHYVFWFMWWATAVGILVRKYFFDVTFRQDAWIIAIFLITSVGLAYMDLRDGHYDCYTKPGWKSYLLYSIAFSLFFTGLVLVHGFRNGWYTSVQTIFVVGALTEIVLFIFLYVLMVCVGTLTKKRRRKLEEQLMDTEE